MSGGYGLWLGVHGPSESAGGHVIKFRQATLDALEPFKWDGGACCQTTKLKATLKKSPLLLQPG